MKKIDLGVDVRLIIGNIVFWCLILMDWTDLFGATNALFTSPFATKPMLVVGQIAQAFGLPYISVSDFASFMVATAISLTIYTQGKDLILRLIHKERPWFQWGMFGLSVIISLAGNGAAFYQDMFGSTVPFLSASWVTPFVLGFFVSYGLFSVVSSEAFAQFQKIKKAQQAKVAVPQIAKAQTQSTNENTKPVEVVVKKSRKDLTKEEKSLIYSRKDRKPRATKILDATQPLVAVSNQAELAQV